MLQIAASQVFQAASAPIRVEFTFMRQLEKLWSVPWCRAWPWFIYKLTESNLLKAWAHDRNILLYVAVSKN